MWNAIEETRLPSAGEPLPAWYALWTRSNCERTVSEQLRTLGFRTFLPEIRVWSTRGAARSAATRPLMPGYLFLHQALDKESYRAIVSARGLVRVLSEGWSRLSIVPDVEVESIRRIVDAQPHPTPFPYLDRGQRVRIRRGPLTGVEGILVNRRDDQALLVVSIELFRRSFSVEVDCALAEAV